jgi:hypothetical protein
VDVEAVLDDIDTALAAARVLGLHGAEDLPERLTPAQRRRAARAVQAATVEIYTGKDDRILRRLHVDLQVADAKDGAKTVALDLSLTGVNEGQNVSAPSDPRPFDELMSLLRGFDLALGAGGGAPRVR